MAEQGSRRTWVSRKLSQSFTLALPCALVFHHIHPTFYLLHQTGSSLSLHWIESNFNSNFYPCRKASLAKTARTKDGEREELQPSSGAAQGRQGQGNQERYGY